MTQLNLYEDYKLLKALGSGDSKGLQLAEQLARTAAGTVSYLNKCHRIELKSGVPGKEYFAYSLDKGGAKLSRSINAGLYDSDALKSLDQFVAGNMAQLADDVRAKLLYTMAAAFFACVDLVKTGDQKTPATYFEVLIGHIMSRAFGTNKRNEVEVLHLEGEADTLPTDFIFDLGVGHPKFHVPVKTSTRERAIQVFAHQRILDGVYGTGAFTGLLVCFAETKLDHTKREVIEICVPKQLRLYQRHIASMNRFYYFDVPAKYAALAQGNPPMAVKEFSAFFSEAHELGRR